MRLLKNYWPMGLVLSALFFLVTNNRMDLLWLGRWGVVLGLLSLVFAWVVGYCTTLFLSPLVAYVLLSGIYSTFFSPRFMQEDLIMQVQLRAAGAMAALSFFTLAWFGSAIPDRVARRFQTAFAIAGFLTALGILAGPFRISSLNLPQVLFFDNASMAGCFVACTLPWMDNLCQTRGVRAALWAFVTFAIVLTQASTPMLALLAVAGVYAYRFQYLRKVLALGLGGATVAALALAPWSKWSSPNGRVEIWTTAWVWFSHQPWYVQVFGFGPGTTWVALPSLEIAKSNLLVGQSIETHPWMHNDWFQIVFELGFLGAALAALGLVGVVGRARRNPVALAGLAAFAVSMATNFPVHLGLHALLGVVLVRSAFLAEDE